MKNALRSIDADHYTRAPAAWSGSAGGDIHATGGRLAVEAHVAETSSSAAGRPESHVDRDDSTRMQLVTRDAAMQPVLQLAARVADLDAPVMIIGETGVGKELVARCIHQHSARAAMPFIRVTCGSLTEGALQETLGEREEGAATAHSTRRAWAVAPTLFLDEISELTSSAQALLIHTLKERERPSASRKAVRMGGPHLIVSTRQSLDQLAHAGRVRPDLLYRLSVVPIHVPPLRARPADVSLLAERFVEQYAQELVKEAPSVGVDAMTMLTAYPWPGNISELKRCMQRAVLICDTGEIHAEHLPSELARCPREDGPRQSLPAALEQLEREMITCALQRSRGNMAEAARMLGITERIVRLRVRHYGMDWHAIRASSGRLQRSRLRSTTQS